MAFVIGLAMARIILNGKETTTKHNTLTEFLGEIELPKVFVVEKNGVVIYKENYKDEVVQEGDIIEIASFCGGG